MEVAAGSDRRYDMCVAGRFTAQQRGIRRPPGISVRMGCCLHQKPALAPAVGGAVASRHCLWAGADVGQGVIRRARTWVRLCREGPAGVRCRARLPDITPVPRREHQRLGERRAVWAREPQITVGRRICIGRTRARPNDGHGRHDPESLLVVGATRAFLTPGMCRRRLRRSAHAGLLPRLTDGTLRSSPSTHRSACASDL